MQDKDYTEDLALDEWFKEKWVDISKKDKSGKHPPCGRSDADKGKYPKCRPSKRVSKNTPKTTGEMTKSEKKNSVKKKRKIEKTKKRESAGGKARKPKRAPSIKRKKRKGNKKKSSIDFRLKKLSLWLNQIGHKKEADMVSVLTERDSENG